MQLRAVEVATDRFEFWLVLLKHFISREGHGLVPAKHMESGYRLGAWMNRVRTDSPLALSPAQTSALEEVGFVWDALDAQFENKFLALASFAKTYGHTRVPQKYRTGAIRLGGWVTTLRVNPAQLTPERKQRVTDLGFIWDVREALFQRHFALLANYIEREGDPAVPVDHIEDGVKLGVWVSGLRARRSRAKPAWIAALNDIGFDWNPAKSQFARNMMLLEKYKAREGNTLVPNGHIEDGVALGSWMARIRSHPNLRSAIEVQELSRIGFIWNVEEALFQEFLAALREYKSEHGHIQVPFAYVKNDYQLGSRVANARHRRDSLTPERLKALNKLGFIWRPSESGRLRKNSRA